MRRTAGWVLAWSNLQHAVLLGISSERARLQLTTTGISSFSYGRLYERAVVLSRDGMRLLLSIVSRDV